MASYFDGGFDGSFVADTDLTTHQFKLAKAASIVGNAGLADSGSNPYPVGALRDGPRAGRERRPRRQWVEPVPDRRAAERPERWAGSPDPDDRVHEGDRPRDDLRPRPRCLAEGGQRRPVRAVDVDHRDRNSDRPVVWAG